MSSNGNTYAEGAAIAHGLSVADASLIPDSAKDAFRRAFHVSLWAYLYRCDRDNRDWIVEVIKVVSRCVEEGKTLDETRDVLSQAAVAAGRT